MEDGRDNTDKAGPLQPLTYATRDNENELNIPGINVVKSILEAMARGTTVRRVVMTSSFASVLNAARKGPPYFTYTGSDWTADMSRIDCARDPCALCLPKCKEVHRKGGVGFCTGAEAQLQSRHALPVHDLWSHRIPHIKHGAAR